MPFTRRLYELEEVIGAFMSSLRRRRLEESLFWLEELDISCEEEHAIEALFDIWFLQKGLAWWNWLQAWATNKNSVEGRRRLVKLWCGHTKKDGTLWRSYCLALATDKPWDTSTHRKPALEWWARGTPLGMNRKGYESLCSALVGNKRKECTALWLLHMKPKITAIELPEMDDTCLETVEALACENIRRERKYAIPSDAHLGFSARGLSNNTTAILRDTSLYSLLSSPIWAGLLEEYCNEENEWNSETAKEEFYDKYFNCDIPDEWSAKDQEKSHGLAPCLREAYTVSLWLMSWVPDEHRYIYGIAQSWYKKWSNNTILRKNIFNEIEAMYSKHTKKEYMICSNKKIVYKE